LSFSRNKRSEGKSKPDFVFPGIEQYHDRAFPRDRLTMLGVKTTCKDRWRQILDEADQITDKHLFTLETAISEDQTGAMRDRHVQLVIPASLHETFKPAQRTSLLTVRQFLDVVRLRASSQGSETD
jgi:hypothetical protein